MNHETLSASWGKLFPKMAHLSVPYVLSVAAYRPNDTNAEEPISRQRAAYLLDVLGFRRTHNRPADTLDVLSNVLADGRLLPTNLVAWQTIALACYASGDWRRTSTGKRTSTWSPVTPGETDLTSDARAILASYVGVDLDKLDAFKQDRISAKQTRRASAVETIKAGERISELEIAAQSAAARADAAIVQRDEALAMMAGLQTMMSELAATVRALQTAQTVRVKANGHKQALIPA